MYNKAQAQDSQHQLIERYAPLVKRIAFHLLARLRPACRLMILSRPA